MGNSSSRNSNRQLSFDEYHQTFVTPPEKSNEQKTELIHHDWSLPSTLPTYSEAINSSTPPVTHRLSTRVDNIFSGRSRHSERSSSRRQHHVPSRDENLRESICQSRIEDALEMLRKYDTVIIVDDSGSMYGQRWREARDALASLVETASKYDIDGIDIHFLNDPQCGLNMKSDAAVQRLFDNVRPLGITPIGEKLDQLLSDYLSLLCDAKDSGSPHFLKAIKPVNYIVITDGAPTDDPEEVIINAARRLDARNFPLSQVGIQFVQIGNSRGAADYLQELDNGLAAKEGIRDMVDTTRYEGKLTKERIIKILLGGINRRVDKKGAETCVE